MNGVSTVRQESKQNVHGIDTKAVVVEFIDYFMMGSHRYNFLSLLGSGLARAIPYTFMFR